MTSKEYKEIRWKMLEAMGKARHLIDQAESHLWSHHLDLCYDLIDQADDQIVEFQELFFMHGEEMREYLKDEE